MSTQREVKHAPWFYTGTVEDESGFPCITDEDDLVICSICDDGLPADELLAADIQEARLHLIAAAPEMRDLLKRARKILEAQALMLSLAGQGDAANIPILNEIDATIAKAEGAA